MSGLRYSVPLVLLIFLSACGGGDEWGDKGEQAVDQSTDQPGVQTAEGHISASVLEGYSPLTVEFTANDIPRSPAYLWNFGDGSNSVSDADPAAPTSHTYKVPGVYTVKFQYEDWNGNTHILSKQITVHANVNLIISNFAIPKTITPGSDVTISATIQNVGTEPLYLKGEKYLHVGYYLSEDETITADDILIGDTTIVLGSNELTPGLYGISDLGPQETYTYNHQLHLRTNIPAGPYLPEGKYFAGAIVDYIDYYDWYTFPSATDTREYGFPAHITVPEIDETDNASIALTTTSISASCKDDDYENDDSPAQATHLVPGDPVQDHNFCFDNADWYSFDATAGEVYQITTSKPDAASKEVDTQLILYGQDGKEIILFHDNIGNGATTDLLGAVAGVSAEIVWRATESGRYFVKARMTACDEDICQHVGDGAGLGTDYSIELK